MANQQMNPEQVKQYVMGVVQQSGVSPEVFVELGKMAEQVIKDKSLYPQFVNQAISSGIASPDDFSQNVDYSAIASMVAIGRVCQSMGQPMAGMA